MNLAVISTHGIHRVKIAPLDGEKEDSTSFMQWLAIFDGIHFCYEQMTDEDISWLKDFDVVMMSGHLRHIVDIIKIAKYLKDSNTVSMFYPEGSTQLYDNSIRGFHKEYYEAWNACDVLSICEEDKVAYYENFVTKETIVRFVHVPVTHDMINGKFLMRERDRKKNAVIVYGDNNPNHPMIAAACARNIGADIWMVECGDEAVSQIRHILNYEPIWSFGKQSQNAFLRNLGLTIVHFYPTEWIGTARQVISCATVGTPCIGSRDSHTQQRLFPDLATRIYDINEMTELAKMLLKDSTFYNRIIADACKAVEFYNLENTTKRFYDVVANAKERKLKFSVIS